MHSDHPARRTLNAQQVVFLDLVRGAAASCVLLHHIFLLFGRPELAGGVSLGSLGVTTFFLLSGFLIDQSVQRHAQSHYDLRDFLIDRVCRVYVCYVPALIFTALLVAPLAQRADFVGEPHVGVLHFLGNLLMLQDYPAFQVARRAGIEASWFVRPYALAEPYWTVPIELYLYVVFGVLYFRYAAAGRRNKPSLTLGILACIALLPALYHAATGYGQCLTLTWLLGVAGSRLMSRRPAAPEPRVIALWLVVAALLLGLRLLSRGQSFYDLQNALFLGMLMLGGLWTVTHLPWFTHPLLKEPAAFFAKTSYPLYLTHNVLVGWAIMHLGENLSVSRFALLFVCCHACAYAFWWAFDRHYKGLATWLRSTTSHEPGTAAEAARG